MNFLFNQRPGNPIAGGHRAGVVFHDQGTDEHAAAKAHENNEVGSKIGIEGVMHHAMPAAGIAMNLIESIEDFRKSFSDTRTIIVNTPNPKDQLNPSKNFKPG